MSRLPNRSAGQVKVVLCHRRTSARPLHYAVAQYNAIFEAQTLTYLRLTGMKLGLVVNIGARVVKNGIHRVANGL